MDITQPATPAFELIFPDGTHVKLWACGHTEGLDGQVIVINGVAPMLDHFYGTALRSPSQLLGTLRDLKKWPFPLKEVQPPLRTRHQQVRASPQ